MIQNVQVLRGVAAILVVFVHLDKLLAQIGLPTWGGGGVDIFFVISGFIMVYTTIGRDIGFSAFMSDRIARIVPAYWIITLAVFLIALIAPALLQATRADGSELLQSLFFIPFTKSNGLIEPVLFVGWTLNYEMFFYLLFACGLAFKRLGIYGVIVCLVCLVGIGLLERPQGVLVRFYTAPIMVDFGLGVVVGLAYQQITVRSNSQRKLAVALLCVTGLTMAIVLPVLLPDVSRIITGGMPAAALIGGAVTSERWGWVIRSRWLLHMGNASYSIYLVHPFVTQIVQKLASRIPPNPVTASLLIALALLGVYAAGTLVHHFLERPLRRWLRTQRFRVRYATTA